MRRARGSSLAAGGPAPTLDLGVSGNASVFRTDRTASVGSRDIGICPASKLPFHLIYISLHSYSPYRLPPLLTRRDPVGPAPFLCPRPIGRRLPAAAAAPFPGALPVHGQRGAPVSAESGKEESGDVSDSTPRICSHPGIYEPFVPASGLLSVSTSLPKIPALNVISDFITGANLIRLCSSTNKNWIN